jgi:hypothetical protein
MLYMRSLLAGNSYSQGMEIPGPPGTTLRYEGAIESRGVDIPAVYAFVMSVATGVTAAIIADWIRDKSRLVALGRFRAYAMERAGCQLRHPGRAPGQ